MMATLGVVLWLLAGAEISPTAAAEPAIPRPDTAPFEPNAADKETARHLVKVGDERFEASDFQGALEAYRGADALVGAPSTSFEVGRAQLELGLLVEARDTLLRVARHPKQPGEPPAFAWARSEAKKLAEGIKPRIPTVLIRVEGAPADTPVQVWVDDWLLRPETVGLPRKENPGEHRVAATAPGYGKATASVTLTEGEESEAVLELAAAPEADTEDGSLAWLIGLGFGVAGAGTIVGAITGAESLSTASDVRDRCSGQQCPRSAQPDADHSTTLAHTSTVSFIVAGAGLGVGVIAWMVEGLAGDDDESESPDQSLALRPVAGWGVVGLSGRF